MWDIKQIEALTEDKARSLSLEILSIKDHNVYLVDFSGYFGYSALVFKNGRHIHYANDYALHHNGKTETELRKWYVDTLNNKLFTEDELGEPIKDYSEYKAKEHFLRNYYPMQTEYVSMFRILHNAAEEEAYEREIENLTVNNISFCYMADKDFVVRQERLYNALQERKKEMSSSLEYWKDAFKREMYNHEYAINWQADYDTLSAFGNVRWHGDNGNLTKYFDDLAFNDTQRMAYAIARREYYNEVRETEF